MCCNYLKVFFSNTDSFTICFHSFSTIQSNLDPRIMSLPNICPPNLFPPPALSDSLVVGVFCRQSKERLGVQLFERRRRVLSFLLLIGHWSLVRPEIITLSLPNKNLLTETLSRVALS